jgi:hypothetical protein
VSPSACRRLRALVVPVASVALGLVLGELLLRHVFHFVPQPDLDLYRRDDAGNLRLRPNLDRRHITPLWDVSVRTNAEGWRDDIDRAAPVLALGDSFGFGWGVEESEGLFRLMETALGASIWNAAVPGTATGDQARLLETYFADTAPRQVLLAFFVGNDFVEERFGSADRFEVADGLLVDKGLTTSRLGSAKSLLRRSRVLQLLRALQFRYFPSRASDAGQTWDDWMRAFAAIHRKDAGPEQFDPALHALDRVWRWCDSRDAQLTLLVIPRSWQVEPQGLAAMTEALHIDPDDLDMDRPQRILRAWSGERNIPVVDLLPAFRQAFSKQPGARLYYSPDAHWTPAGHALAAKAAVRAMQETP